MLILILLALIAATGDLLLMRDNPYIIGPQYRAWEAGYLASIKLFAEKFTAMLEGE